MAQTHYKSFVGTLAPIALGVALVAGLFAAGCASSSQSSTASTQSSQSSMASFDIKDDVLSSQASSSASASSASTTSSSSSASSASASSSAAEASTSSASADAAQSESAAAQDPNGAQSSGSESAVVEVTLPEIQIIEDYRPSFVHGPKGAEYQKYIMLHDTEGEGDPQSVIDYWDGNGNLVAAHFIVGKDGTIYQCVDMDSIAHHAGYGDAGHNALYGVEDESRDDMLGTVPIGDWAPDYGMNSYSIGIEMVHVGGSGDYPEEQLQAVDALIAYIDAYYGFESQIIDHKSWRSGNSDTSPEFAGYLENYIDHRTHN